MLKKHRSKPTAHRTTDGKLFGEVDEAYKWQAQLNRMDRLERYVERHFPNRPVSLTTIKHILNNTADELLSILDLKMPEDWKK